MNEPYTDFVTGRTYNLDAPFPEGLMPCLTAFFEDVHPDLVPGRDVYPEVFASPLFFPLQRKRELERMVRIARSRSPKTVMEIGCDKGGGLYHWYQCLPSVEAIIGCEVRGTPYSDLFNKNLPNVDFLWTRDSRHRDTIASVIEFLDGDRIDVLFIDGDKGAFLDDFNLYAPLMSSSGIVFMHDVTDPDPKRAFNSVKRMGRYKTEVIHDVSEVAEAKGDTAHDGWLRYWSGRSCGVGVIYIG